MNKINTQLLLPTSLYETSQRCQANVLPPRAAAPGPAMALTPVHAFPFPVPVDFPSVPVIATAMVAAAAVALPPAVTDIALIPSLADPAAVFCRQPRVDVSGSARSSRLLCLSINPRRDGLELRQVWHPGGRARTAGAGHSRRWASSLHRRNVRRHSRLCLSGAGRLSC